MADNTNKNYTREMLNSIKIVDLRKIASSFKVPGIRIKKKEKLINDILEHQLQPSSNITKHTLKTAPLRTLKQNEKHTREKLATYTRDVLRPIATSLKVSNIRNMNKEQLINAILQNQDNPSEKVKPTPKISVINDSELSLKSKFNDKILTYSYLPSEKSHNSL